MLPIFFSFQNILAFAQKTWFTKLHKILQKINTDLNNNITNTDNDDIVKLLFEQACIIEGEQITDVAGFANRLTKLLENS